MTMEKETNPSSTLFYSLFITSIFHVSFAAYNITANQALKDGETLTSSLHSFELGFFTPGNSRNRYLGIWYNKSPSTVVWVANRNNPLTDLYGVLTISNGNLVLLNQTNTIIWSSNVPRIVANPVAQLLDTGNLVLGDKNSRGTHEWQSFDYPSDTLLPGMKLGWNLKTGQEYYLTSWRSVDDPSPGDYTHRLEFHGLPQLLITAGSMKKFRTGPWNNSLSRPNVVRNEDELYYICLPYRNSFAKRIKLHQSGELQHFVVYDWNAGWTMLYSTPIDMCDNYGQCGANAICRAPSCECLAGFTAKPEHEFNIQNWSGSAKCERKSILDCQRGEGFLKLEQIKLPDLLDFWLNESMNMEQCESECFKNCSCSAYANMNINGAGKGCLLWFSDLIDIREQARPFRGQDIYIRVPALALESLHNSSKKKRMKTILIVSASTAIGILSIGFAFYVSRKRLKRKGMGSGKLDMEVPLFDMKTIAAATNNFSQANIIGEGGFGPVYKGELPTGQEIAVKRLSKSSGQGVEEFRNEVVIIAKLQHKNFVGLLGSCSKEEERILIYEYMPNKSLDYYIFDHKKSASLEWKRRFDIISGIARGLLYLHQDSKLQIVHRDLKASNILLDCNLDPKISDFGLARIFSNGESEAETKRVIGTYGYMSPEYAIDGKFSVKSDVYSLGVLMLEIISGKKNRGFSHPDHHHSLLGHAWLLWIDGRALELMDTALEDTCVKSQVLRSIQVGLLCVQKLPEDRPAMSSVVFMLGNEGAALPQPKQPGFFTERRSNVDAVSRNEEHNTHNTVTISLLEAR